MEIEYNCTLQYFTITCDYVYAIAERSLHIHVQYENATDGCMYTHVTPVSLKYLQHSENVSSCD